MSSLFSSDRPSTNTHSRLNVFFSEGEGPRACYSDWDIKEISRILLLNCPSSWSQVPRLYIVLRIINQLPALDSIFDQGFNDIWFPFNASSVPTVLSSTKRNEFLEAQSLVLTKAVQLERYKDKPHLYFGKNEFFPFQSKGRLAQGKYGTVDRIFSLLSRQDFARKRFPRASMISGSTESFMTELNILKKIDHRHCVDLVGCFQSIARRLLML